MAKMSIQRLFELPRNYRADRARKINYGARANCGRRHNDNPGERLAGTRDSARSRSPQRNSFYRSHEFSGKGSFVEPLEALAKGNETRQAHSSAGRTITRQRDNAVAVDLWETRRVCSKYVGAALSRAKRLQNQSAL